MDLNYLYHRQQTELMRADAAVCATSRIAHQGLADLFGDMIDGAKERARERGAGG